nr:MAG TPA: Regulator of RpoS, Anti-adapter protein regulator, ClpXP adaptor, anti-adaptor.0A [Caudoviricetes sp.]
MGYDLEQRRTRKGNNQHHVCRVCVGREEAMKEIDNIEIKSTAGLSDVEKYNLQLKALITTKAGTLPGSRGFGISPDILDLGPEQSINLLALELAEKVDQYIPDITVSGIDRSANGKGVVKTQIYIERREQG